MCKQNTTKRQLNLLNVDQSAGLDSVMRCRQGNVPKAPTRRSRRVAVRFVVAIVTKFSFVLNGGDRPVLSQEGQVPVHGGQPDAERREVVVDFLCRWMVATVHDVVIDRLLLTGHPSCWSRFSTLNVGFRYG